MNPDVFGTQAYLQLVAYSERWNIQKFDRIYIPVKHVVISFGNSSRL